MFRVRTFGERLNEKYLVAYLQTKAAKDYFLRCAKRTTNLASINKTQLGQLPVPVPPLAAQRHFADRWTDVRAVIAQQERMAEASERLVASLVAQLFDGSPSPRRLAA